MLNFNLKFPPRSIEDVPNGKEIAKSLQALINRKVTLTGKTRTDGSNIRKTIGKNLIENLPLEQADSNEYIFSNKKGIPKLLTYCIDSYIVTSGENYNLQVWNRLPNSKNPIVEYKNGAKILSCDIRLIFIKINTIKSTIESIVIATSNKIEELYGKMSVPTIKHQLLISSIARKQILEQQIPILWEDDTENIKNISKFSKVKKQSKTIQNNFEPNEAYNLTTLKDNFKNRLIGSIIPSMPTKIRGQYFEKIVAEILGYNVSENDLLDGAYPDIMHQLIEVKLQDSPTVDLGKHSPLFPQIIIEKYNITSKDIRYIIALINKSTNTIEGLIIMPGEKLVKYFSYVPETSFKVQKGINMKFFEKYKGKSVFIG